VYMHSLVSCMKTSCAESGNCNHPFLVLAAHGQSIDGMVRLQPVITVAFRVLQAPFRLAASQHDE
jgi:hypothetical protein